MRYRFTLLFILMCCMVLRAQYDNEWIDNSKSYYKITVAQDGIYRLTYNDLLAAGFPVDQVDPRRLQLFYKGEEQAIYVEGQNDAVFNTSDYLEFFGLKNTGISDTPLYVTPQAQPHTYYSIYSDTSAYFLTYHLTPLDGKRMNTFFENNVGGLPAEDAHLATTREIFTSEYSPGNTFATYARLSAFDTGEGWTGSRVQENQNEDIILNSTNANQLAGLPEMELVLVGRKDTTHTVEVLVGPSTGALRSLGTFEFYNYDPFVLNETLQWSDFNTTSVVLRLRVLGNAAVDNGNDLVSISAASVTYPQLVELTTATGEYFNLLPNPGNKSYVEINQVNSQVNIYDVSDINNVRRIDYNLVGNQANLVVDNTLNGRKLFVEGDFNSPQVEAVDLEQPDVGLFNYFVVTSEWLRRPAGGVNDPVAEYASYRASTEGGGHQVLILNSEKIVNSFNYGLDGPLGLFRFVEYINDQSDPNFLFLIGKGLRPQTDSYRAAGGVIENTVNGQVIQFRDLVPTAGSPGSDLLFSAGFGADPDAPTIPTGRIPARSPQQVLAYLTKVRQMEALPFNQLWRKRILHLSGGISAFELRLFERFVDLFGDTAEDDFLGGESLKIKKQTNSTIELINIADEVNEGLNLITFFGHSAPNITDIDIGFVSNPVLGYNNSNKYPSFLINGCNGGFFFDSNIVFGEDWILADQKGALSFLAHSGFGFTSSLRRFTNVYYDVGYGDSLFINKSIGEIHIETSKRYLETFSNSIIDIGQAQQMVLLGDPAVALFGADLPDFEINSNSVFLSSLEGDEVNSNLDSLALNLVVRNFGRTTRDSLLVRVNRTLPDQSILQVDQVFTAVKYQDTLRIVLDNRNLNSTGENRFTITLDPDAEIDELNEGNNRVSYSSLIPSLGTRNILPYPFAIVDSDEVDLWSSASDLLGDQRTFIFELDTTATFDSPFFQSTTVTSKGLARSNFSLLPETPENDSLVYFWRTKFLNPLPGESDEYQVSSFTYIMNGPEGWSQQLGDQFTENQLQDLEIKEDQLQFDAVLRTVEINTLGGSHPDYPSTNSVDSLLNINIRIDGQEYQIDNQKLCRRNTINFITFNKNTAVPYAALPLIFQDPRTCGRQPQVINSFTNSELESGTNDLSAYIDAVAAGDSVVMFSIGDVAYSGWSANVRSKLEEIGVDGISSWIDGEPVIIYARKGDDPGEADVFRTSNSPPEQQALNILRNLSGISGSGVMRSVTIGPASNWIEFYLNKQPFELPDTDNTRVDVIGIAEDGSESVLKSLQSTTPINDISAATYPYLRLDFVTADDVNLTPTNLKTWLVSYEPYPEGVLLAAEGSPTSLMVSEGEEAIVNLKFLNISNKSFSDSLQVNVRQTNSSTGSTQASEFRIEAPLPQDTTAFSVDFTTVGYVGNNGVNVFVNPRIEPEISFDNNILQVPGYLTVEEDNENPILDVVFDGVHIVDGDIVAPSPLIAVRLKEENEFLLKTDTLGMDLFLKPPCEGCSFQRIPFSSEQVQWFPANENEDFRVEFKPDPLEDGIYTLRIQAQDESGNLAGEEPFSVRFEVINESSISNFYPYPNPFSTSTRFIFTLTGAVIPNQLKIQIMTVSGKVVREITQDEIGVIRIGNNITDYAWDGKDEFGDQLANGVYLYRVIMKTEDMNHRETAGDRGFKNGYGKLYLLR